MSAGTTERRFKAFPPQLGGLPATMIGSWFEDDKVRCHKDSADTAAMPALSEAEGNLLFARSATAHVGTAVSAVRGTKRRSPIHLIELPRRIGHTQSTARL